MVRTDSAHNWDAESRNVVTFHGGDHPLYDANERLYYFYDLQIATEA